MMTEIGRQEQETSISARMQFPWQPPQQNNI